MSDLLSLLPPENAKSVCIQDFCGTAKGVPCQFWADYFPDYKVTIFGGDWRDVPPLFKNDPTEIEVDEWAQKHNGCWWED